VAAAGDFFDALWLAQGRDGGVEAGAVGDGLARRAFADAVEEAGQDAAGAEFEEKIAPGFIDEILDRLRPADGAGDLILQGLADFIGFPNGRGIDVANDREARGGEGDFLQLLAELEEGGIHEPGVVGTGDVERFREADAVLFGERDGERDLRAFAGDDDLAGAVQICHIHVGFGGEGADGALVRADHRGHSAAVLRAGFLHKEAALGDEAQAGFKVEGAGGGVRGEFAERKAGGGVDGELADLGAQRSEAGEAVDEKGRLAIGRLRERFLRTGESDGAERTPEDRVGA